MLNFKERLQEYADVIIRKGLGIDKDRLLIIDISAELHGFAELLVEAAYKAGAEEVRTDFHHRPLTRLDYAYRTEESLSRFPAWEIAKFEEAVELKPARLYITSADPDGLKGIDQQKMQAVQQAQYPIVKPYIEKIENRYPWCIAAAAAPAWAKKIFPELSEAEAVERLWEEIFKACRVRGDGSAVAAWDEHNRNFEERSKWLNEQAFDYLRMRSAAGTDFKVWLNAEVKWAGGCEKLGNERSFNPNMPTEEIFTTPMAGKAEGIVYATKPLSVQGQLVDNFWIRFEDGAAVEWDAEQGKDVLDTLLTMDEGARRLGEVALVPDASPISQSGVLFYNTLFDENASCHLALGRGFSNLLEGFESMSREEHIAKGINDSMIHTDFMIGSDDMRIDGVTRDGEVVPVFRNGNWA